MLLILEFQKPRVKMLFTGRSNESTQQRSESTTPKHSEFQLRFYCFEYSATASSMCSRTNLAMTDTTDSSAPYWGHDLVLTLLWLCLFQTSQQNISLHAMWSDKCSKTKATFPSTHCVPNQATKEHRNRGSPASLYKLQGCLETWTCVYINHYN